MTRKQEIKSIIAILSFSMVLMGIVAVGSGLAVIKAHFTGVSQTKIQLLVNLPSVIIIFATIAAGKIQEYLSKKTVLLIGAALFLVAGVSPAFMDNFTLILIMRVFFGIGVGFMQPMSSAIVSYYFTGEKRHKVMGWQSAAQQLGSASMSLLGGVLANIGWNYTFFAHGVVIIPLVLVPLLLPAMKGAREDAVERGEKTKIVITRGAVLWIAAETLFFFFGQVNAIYNSFLVAEKGIGTPADLGIGSIFSSIMGMLTGIFFSRLRDRLGRYTFAFGLLMLAIGDTIVSLAPSMKIFYISSFFAGTAFGICMPVMNVGVTSAVDTYSTAMAVAIAMSAKSIAQFVCPNVLTPLADYFVRTVGSYGRNRWVYTICAVSLYAAAAAICVGVFIKNKKEKNRLAQNTYIG